MVSILTKHWNSYALPDGHPDKAVLRAEEQLELAQEIRREIYLENTTDLRIRRHTSDKSGKNGAKAAKDRQLDELMLLAVGSPAYMQAYNHQLSFSIDGQELEISQGHLHELSKQYAEDLHHQIDNARTRNLDPTDLALMHTELTHVENIAATTDPQHGKMSDEDAITVRDHLAHSHGLQEEIVNLNMQRNTPEFGMTQAENAYRGDFDIQNEAAFSVIESTTPITSFASSIEDTPLNTNIASASNEFNLAARDLPADAPEPQTPNTAPSNTGFTL